MPELPEVETIRRDLEPRITGRTITSAWVSETAPRLVQLTTRGDFCTQLTGQRIKALGRRGKYLILNLESGLMWVVHLRMTGRLQHTDAGCPDTQYLRARFALDDATELCFIDLRKLGMMWLVDDWAAVNSNLGPEPLEEAFDLAAFRASLRRRSAPIKSVLLDQSVLAGVGNIYADEALFAAKVRPTRSANSLSAPATSRLHSAVRDVLMAALGDRGSSFSDYVDASGRPGGHQLNVQVFRRTDQACFICGTSIKRIKLGGRSTHYCPKCQR
jgi:formamidopyrimidine-DNA glycosylase